MLSEILGILGPILRLAERVADYATSAAKSVEKRIKRDKKWNKAMLEKDKKELSDDEFLK